MPASRTYLTVHYEQRSQVKALGARWDSDAKKWFVPDGMQLQVFAPWLPQGAGAKRQVALTSDAEGSGELLPSLDKGIRLAHLLQGVSAAVTGAYPGGVWTRLEVVDVSVRNHVYLEVADRETDGRMLAKARAMIWSRVAQKILPEFEKATGMQLAPGIKLLVRAKPTMHPEFGFGLEVDAIDPQYTLGDLEAKKRDIRTRLKAEGLWERNRGLSAPWDFNQVLVVAPSQAAGLGDFQAEAQRLQAAGVCTFAYAASRFQGEGAAAEICDAANTALQRLAQLGTAPDVIVIIRGGGAANDLAWLNEYCLARFICEAPAPVFTGIGHQRDSTVLDEVAHSSFDTPSKVIANIEGVIFDRARQAKTAYEVITARAQRICLQTAARAQATFEGTKQEAHRVHAKATRSSDALIGSIRQEALGHVRSAIDQTAALHIEVRDGAHMMLASAKGNVPILMNDVHASAKAAMIRGRHLSASHVAGVIERAGNAVGRKQEAAVRAMRDVALGARQGLEARRHASEALFREITGQGPDKTLRRGFAVVRDRQGRAVTRAAQARVTGHLEVQFQDGVVPAIAQKKEE